MQHRRITTEHIRTTIHRAVTADDMNYALRLIDHTLISFADKAYLRRLVSYRAESLNLIGFDDDENRWLRDCEYQFRRTRF